jgi:hypothetical protein
MIIVDVVDLPISDPNTVCTKMAVHNKGVYTVSACRDALGNYKLYISTFLASQPTVAAILKLETDLVKIYSM